MEVSGELARGSRRPALRQTTWR